MARDYLTLDDEQRLPYWVQLVKANGDTSWGSKVQPKRTMLHLDLRGGEFTRASARRLERTFGWLIDAVGIRYSDVHEYALEITPLTFGQANETLLEQPGYRPGEWPAPPGVSFLWLPIPYDQREQELYPWQRAA